MKDKDLRKVLIKLGISTNIAGFNYILKAVEILKSQKTHINITNVYEDISRESYGETNQNITRDIRYAIESSYKKNTILRRIYGEKPDNTSLLYDLAFNLDVFIEETEEKV